jgi:hypothetical protein
MSTWTTITKNISSFTNQAITGILTYFVAENNTIYLVGSTEEDYLITQDVTTWIKTTKN